MLLVIVTHLASNLHPLKLGEGAHTGLLSHPPRKVIPCPQLTPGKGREAEERERTTGEKTSRHRPRLLARLSP